MTAQKIHAGVSYFIYYFHFALSETASVAESRLYAESVTASGGIAKSSLTLQIEKEMKKLRRQDFWLKIQRTKLLMDLLFVTYELFSIRYAPKTVKTLAGLSAALLR